MKRAYVVILCGMMSLMLTACGGEKSVISDLSDKIDESDIKEIVSDKIEETDIKEIVSDKIEESVNDEISDEYYINEMNTGFRDGLAWAKINLDPYQTVQALINDDLEIVYELAPEEEFGGDIYGGKAVIVNASQVSNPGFSIVGSNGEILYNCTDVLGGIDTSGYAVSLTKDGGAVYARKESGISAETVYVCVLNDNFENVSEVEVPRDDYNSYYDISDFYYLSDGVYLVDLGNNGLIIDNTNNNTIFGINSQLDCYTDNDNCVGFLEYDGGYCYYANSEALDYNSITNSEDFISQLESIGNVGISSSDEDEIMTGYSFSNHRFYSYECTYVEGVINYISIDGVELPDFGAVFTDNFNVSDDLNYFAISMMGYDGNYYITVVNRDGQSLYEPTTSYPIDYSDELDLFTVCDGYILSRYYGLTPNGEVIDYEGDIGFSGIGNDTVAGSYNGGETVAVSDGYIACRSGLYSLDGTRIAAVTAYKWQ